MNMASELSRRQVFQAAGVVAGAGLIGTTIAQQAEAAVLASPWDDVPAILARIIPPTFPANTFDIRDYGAVGNNSTDCTNAFKNAIAACNAAGGGRVLVTGGTYRTGKIHLLSNVELNVAAGATIRFKTDTGSYLPNVFTRWQGIECYNFSPFIYANGQTNIAITGGGTIDGNAPAGSWSAMGGGGTDWTNLQNQGKNNVPVAQRQYGSGHNLRPNLIGLYNCTNVLLDGFTSTNPAMWSIHPVYCTNVTARNLTLRSTNSQGDGIDPDSCTDVYIHDCKFDTNDDCIPVKSGRNWDGRRVNRPSQNIVIERCKFSGRWGGVTCGSEASGGVRNVFASDCECNAASFPGRYPVKYALYIKTNSDRGGYIQNINLRNVTGHNLEREALHISQLYNGGGGGAFPATISDITVDGMVIDGADFVVRAEGQSGNRITNVQIMNSTFTGITGSDVITQADVVYTNCMVNGVPRGGTGTTTRYEAENAVISQGLVEANHTGFSGTGFVNTDNIVGSYVEWTVNVATAGTATLRFRHSNGTTTNRPAAISINGTQVAASQAFNPTTNWDTWATVTISASLLAGNNTVRVTATTANGCANLDYLEIVK